MMPDDLSTFDALATVAGASFLCHLVVQYTNNLWDRALPIPTDLDAVVVCALILLLAQLDLEASAGDWRVYVHYYISMTTLLHHNITRKRFFIEFHQAMDTPHQLGFPEQLAHGITTVEFGLTDQLKGCPFLCGISI